MSIKLNEISQANAAYALYTKAMPTLKEVLAKLNAKAALKTTLILSHATIVCIFWLK